MPTFLTQVLQEAAALVSVALFVGMICVFADAIAHSPIIVWSAS